MSTTAIPSVAIVLINWNNYEDSQKCLISLQKCTYGNFLAIVVDNDSQDGSGTRLQDEFGDFAHFIFSDQNLGFSGGNNLGFRYALDQRFDYVMELNNDTEVEADFLDRLVQAIHHSETFAAAQPLIYYNGQQRDVVWNAGGTLLRPLGLSLTRKENVANPTNLTAGETDWITGCAFMVKSEVLRKTGLLKEFFFFGSFEDVDLSLRIRSLGYKLWFEPSSVIYHSVGSSSKTKAKGREGFLNPKVHYLTQRNQMIFIRQHTPKVFVPLAVSAQMVKMLAYSLYFIVLWRPVKLKMVWAGFKDGLLNTYHD